MKVGQNGRPGATGEFPEGHHGDEDEGELSIGIGPDMHGNLRLEFGKPVAWLSMPPEKAVSFAKLLLRTSYAMIQAKR
jgi:hypothetical protein